MHVSAPQIFSLNSRPYFKSAQVEEARPSQISSSVSNTGAEDSKKKRNKLITYSALVGAGVIAAATGGVALYRHSSPEYVLKNLKHTKLTESLPYFLKEDLAKGNKFAKFEEFIKSPDPKYITGTGLNSKVYNIPFMDKYVLKIINETSSLDPAKQYVGLFPSEINLGQAVWNHPDNARILLLKKINGRPYSIDKWNTTLYNPITKGPINVTQEQADLYYSQISQIAKMDQSIFDNLAHQIKVLDNTKKFDDDYFVGFKTDSINPNNLMVDFKNNTINIIDYFGKENEHHKNSYMDIVAIMSDFALMPEYRDLLKPNQQKELVNIIKTIHSKALKAAEKEGISTNKNDFLEYIYEVHNCPAFRPMPVARKDGNGEYIRTYTDRAHELISIIEG